MPAEISNSLGSISELFTEAIVQYIDEFQLFSFIVSLITFIATIKIFQKAEISPFVLLIPIYNVYVFYKLVGMQKWFWRTIGVAFLTLISLGALLLAAPDEDTALIGTVILGLILGFYIFCLSILYAFKLSYSFDHGVFFAIGYMLFPHLFLLILAFGNSDYVG